MTIDQLEMIEAAIETGSFKGAAKRLNKTQPSISMGIKKVEEFYGITLFSREAYRPVLTEQGQIIYKEALQALRAFRQFERVARDMSIGNEPYVNITVDPLVDLLDWLPMLEDLASERCSTELRFLSGIMDDNANAVLTGKAQIGIGVLGEKNFASMHYRYLKREILLPCISKNSPYFKDFTDTKANMDVLRTIPQVTVLSKFINPKLGSQGLQWHVSSHDQKQELIAKGVGWGRVTESFLKENRNLLFPLSTELAEPLHLELAIFKNRDFPLGPIGTRVWEAGIKLAGG